VLEHVTRESQSRASIPVSIDLATSYVPLVKGLPEACAGLTVLGATSDPMCLRPSDTARYCTAERRDAPFLCRLNATVSWRNDL
jgi:hypothetical protein